MSGRHTDEANAYAFNESNPANKQLWTGNPTNAPVRNASQVVASDASTSAWSYIGGETLASACRRGKAIGGAVKELGFMVADGFNDAAYVLTDGEIGYRGHLSGMEKAFDRGDVKFGFNAQYGHFVHETFANAYTFGVADQLKASIEYRSGAITDEEFADRLAVTGAFQAAPLVTKPLARGVMAVARPALRGLANAGNEFLAAVAEEIATEPQGRNNPALYGNLKSSGRVALGRKVGPADLKLNADGRWYDPQTGRYDIPGRIGKVDPPTHLLGPDGKPNVPFGNATHELIADWLRQQYKGVNVEFKFQVKPNQRGVDVTVLKDGWRQTGFKFAEIKPRSTSGQSAMTRQVRNWVKGGKVNSWNKVKAITYDADGNIYIGW